MKIIFDIFGLFGLGQILLAFILLQRRKFTDDTHLYNLLNIFGGIMLGIYTAYYGAWISTILNAIWAVVALWDMVGNLRRSRRM